MLVGYLAELLHLFAPWMLSLGVEQIPCAGINFLPTKISRYQYEQDYTRGASLPTLWQQPQQHILRQLLHDHELPKNEISKFIVPNS